MAQRLVDGPESTWLTAEDVCQFLGVGATRFKEMVADGTFPRPVTLGKGDLLQRWSWFDCVSYMHLRSRHLAALDPRGPPVAEAREQQPSSPKGRRR